MVEEYKKECSIIEQFCIYNAETHNIIARKAQRKTFWLQAFPAILTSLSALLVVGQVVPAWWGWTTLVTAVVAAVGSTMDTKTAFFSHLYAAKHFSALRHQARGLRDTYSVGLTDVEMASRTKELSIRYDDLIHFTPLTDNKSFEKARKRIKDGIHKPDKI